MSDMDKIMSKKSSDKQKQMDGSLTSSVGPFIHTIWDFFLMG